MLPLVARVRLHQIETELRRRDPAFVARLETMTAAALLPPTAQVPADGPVRSRGPGPTGRAGFRRRQPVGLTGRGWLRLFLLGWVAIWTVLAIGSTTRGGVVVCAVMAGVVLIAAAGSWPAAARFGHAAAATAAARNRPRAYRGRRLA